MRQNIIDLAFAHAGWVALISVMSIIVSILIVSRLIAKLPTDYFDDKRRKPAPASNPMIRYLLVGVKNIFGFMLVVVGLVLLVTPGQGVVTILAGMMLMNYPGKYALERSLVRRPGILSALNWLRARQGQPPLDSPQTQSDSDK